MKEDFSATGTRKSVQLVFVTASGLVRTKYSGIVTRPRSRLTFISLW